MKTGVIDDTVLKLHTALDGAVWYLDGGGMPARSGLRPAEFLQTPFCRLASRFRLPGTSANAPLLMRLYERRLKNEVQSVEVCSPLVGRAVGASDDPAVLLVRMRSFSLPPSLGGWHQFGMLDAMSYAMAVASAIPQPGLNPSDLLARHPVWPYASFMPHLNCDKLARLIGVILDPRWYVDQADPDSLGPLKSYLGLRPDTVKAALVPGSSGVKVDRARLVIDAWRAHHTPSADDVAKPGYFLYRALSARPPGPEAVLRVSQSFVTFLRNAWLDSLYAFANNDGMFIPEHYFRGEPGTASAFKTHLAHAADEARARES